MTDPAPAPPTHGTPPLREPDLQPPPSVGAAPPTRPGVVHKPQDIVPWQLPGGWRPWGIAISVAVGLCYLGSCSYMNGFAVIMACAALLSAISQRRGRPFTTPGAIAALVVAALCAASLMPYAMFSVGRLFMEWDWYRAAIMALVMTAGLFVLFFRAICLSGRLSGTRKGFLKDFIFCSIFAVMVLLLAVWESFDLPYGNILRGEDFVVYPSPYGTSFLPFSALASMAAPAIVTGYAAMLAMLLEMGLSRIVLSDGRWAQPNDR